RALLTRPRWKGDNVTATIVAPILSSPAAVTRRWPAASRTTTSRAINRRTRLRSTRGNIVLIFADQGLFEYRVSVHLLHHAPGAKDHAGERILGRMHGQLRLHGEEPVEPAQQRAPACQDDPTIHDVRAQLGRGALERLFDGFHH